MKLDDKIEVEGKAGPDGILENFQDVSLGASEQNLKPFYQKRTKRGGEASMMMTAPLVEEDSWSSAIPAPAAGKVNRSK